MIVETANLHQLTLARSQMYCAGKNGSLSYYYGSRVPAIPRTQKPSPWPRRIQ